MSGGSLCYFYSTLEDHAGDFKDKELDELVSDLAKLFHDREWFLSCDIGKGDWIEARDQFKAKWFTPHGREERIEKYIIEVVEEIRDEFGISKRRCMNCMHWFNSEKHKGIYGDCQKHPRCLYQRYESCDDFKEKENKDGAESKNQNT